MGFSFKDERDELEQSDRRLREGLDAIPVRDLRRDAFDWRVLDALRPDVPWHHRFFDLFWFERRPGSALFALSAALLVLIVALLVTHLRSSVPMASITPPSTNGSTTATVDWLTRTASESATPPPAVQGKHSPDRTDAGMMGLH
jgi:hypothetical protein